MDNYHKRKLRLQIASPLNLQGKKGRLILTVNFFFTFITLACPLKLKKLLATTTKGRNIEDHINRTAYKECMQREGRLVYYYSSSKCLSPYSLIRSPSKS